MKQIGVIAEYNPFHNGHQYQINSIKAQFPDRKIIVVMSGDYVQRGEPAIFHKYLRAKCALTCGADIIFELPAPFAYASAEYFATAALSALYETGQVDTLCCGAEDNEPAVFSEIADLLLDEPESYRIVLKKQLKDGLSYPKARSKALAACLCDNQIIELLNHPNNILAIEYIKAVKKYKFPIDICIIKRQGAGYYDGNPDKPMCSAFAIRKMLAKGNTDLHSVIPEKAVRQLENSPHAKPLFWEDFYPFLQYAIWDNSSYAHYFEMSASLSNRLKHFDLLPADLAQLNTALSGRHITNTRLNRTLLNLLLKEPSISDSGQARFIPYLRLLGFKESAGFLLKEMKNTCRLPIINKVADAEYLLSEAGRERFQKDIQNNRLYRQVFYNKYGIPLPTEYEQTVIIEK